MKDAHRKYLRKAVCTAAILCNSSIETWVSNIPCAKTSVYQLIRDIVCDVRFYCVIENDEFWIDYARAVIEKFVDTLNEENWKNNDIITSRKEDFLNKWFSRHITPLTQSEKDKIMADFNLYPHANRVKEIDPFYVETYSEEDDDVNDYTGRQIEMEDNLPSEMRPLYRVGRGKDEIHNAEAEFLRQIDPELVKLARQIGRCGGSMRETQGRFQSASRSDISGVTVGNDLNSLLPTEVALLSSKQTQSVFLHRFVQKRLQIFSSASRSFERGKEKSGPIYLCMDTSSSMFGDPEVLAKTLALAVAILVQRNKRPICMINYSYEVDFFVLTDFRRQRQDFLKFLSRSYGGGNDENILFKFIFEQLPEMPKYKQFSETFDNADLLIVSDFEWFGINKEVSKNIIAAKKNGMRLYALNVDAFGYDEEDEEFNAFEAKFEDVLDDDGESVGFINGRDFFESCDFRYIYKDGKILKLNDKEDEV